MDNLLDSNLVYQRVDLMEMMMVMMWDMLRVL